MSVKKNLISNFILSGATILFPVIIFPYIIRTLSTANYGRVAFIDAFTQYFIIFSSVGIPYYGIREVAKKKDDSVECSRLSIELVTIQIGLSVIFSIIFLLLPIFVPKLRTETPLIYIGCLYILFNSFMIEWYYQGVEKFKFIAQRTIFIKVITAILILCLVRTSTDYVTYYSVTVLSIMLNGAVNFWYFLKNFYKRSNNKINMARHFKPLLVLFSMSFSVSVYTLFDSIILGMLKSPSEVSMYTRAT